MHFVKVIKSKCLNSLKFSLSLIVSVRLHTHTHTHTHAIGVGRDQEMPLANQSTQMEVPYSPPPTNAHTLSPYMKNTHTEIHTLMGWC